jgi:hypothetical protein
MDEREVLVRDDSIPVREPLVERALQHARRLAVVPLLVLAQARGEHRLALRPGVARGRESAAAERQGRHKSQ